MCRLATTPRRFRADFRDIAHLANNAIILFARQIATIVLGGCWGTDNQRQILLTEKTLFICLKRGASDRGVP
jgi:hypothetical protein